MKPETTILKLRLKGYSLSRIAQEVGATRQYVYFVVHSEDGKEFKAERIRRKIKEILES